MLFIAHLNLRHSIPKIMFIVALGLWSCQSELPPPAGQSANTADNVEVQWTWKRTVKGDVNFIYGTVQNNNDQTMKQVALEFRTQDAQGNILMTRNFVVENLPAQGQKLFSEDYPVHAQEDSGFVVVKKVIPSE